MNEFDRDINFLMNEANLLILRIITMAVRTTDTVALESFGIDRKVADELLNMSIDQQMQLAKDCGGMVINFSMNQEAFNLARNKVRRNSVRNQFTDKLIRSGAPHALLQKYTGMDKPEFARRRKLLNIKILKGRPTQPEKDIARLIDLAWMRDISDFKSDELDLELSLFDDTLLKYYLLSKEFNIPIVSIWAHNNSLNFQ